MNKFYKIISSIDIQELESKVNGYIKEGWTPLGSISFTNCMIDKPGTFFEQKITKQEIKTAFIQVVFRQPNDQAQATRTATTEHD